MQNNQAIKLFRDRNPKVGVRPKVKAATSELVVIIKPRHTRGALINDMCECTGARAIKGVNGFLDAAVGLTQTYVLHDIGGGYAEVMKYQTTKQARGVIDANDLGVGLVGQAMTFAPPIPSRRPGANTQAKHRLQPKARKQTAEHIAKRNASRQRSAGRRLLSNATREV